MALRYPSERWNNPVDGNGFPVITKGTKDAGENIADDRSTVEFSYTGTNLTSATTLAVQSTSGFFHGMMVGSISTPSLVLYDGVVPSGTVLMRFNAGLTPGFYPFDEPLGTGLSVDAIAGGGGVAPFIRFFTR